MKRIIVTSVSAGATTTLTVPVSGTLASVDFSQVTAAAGSWELSKSSTSQIATALPDTSVICRTRTGATAGGQVNAHFEPKLPVKILDYLYIHTTGAGNVGEATLRID